ncbi:hypothetical protein MsAg5_06190 [Methanosarcinaceae archaeon Ag5]|uniref:Methanogenesis regulatory protein FilR1 middle domain-containing protein n=1 Tax=Methanolapillus africanus TaxID=3028297 RepID=A0AAE4MIW5_9EURY|nr:hypothetical protein [Methanosarcinaceae archaeon Ag5]
MGESGKDMTMIVTPKVFDRMKGEYGARLEKFIGKENVTFLVYNEKGKSIAPSMLITDVFTYTYLFNNDGVYDNKMLISFDDMTKSWTKELYKHIKKSSVPVEQYESK